MTGGPVQYTGDDMKEAHRGMSITGEEFDVIAAHLDTAPDENGVGDHDRKQILNQIEALRPEIVEV